MQAPPQFKVPSLLATSICPLPSLVGLVPPLRITLPHLSFNRSHVAIRVRIVPALHLLQHRIPLDASRNAHCLVLFHNALKLVAVSQVQ